MPDEQAGPDTAQRQAESGAIVVVNREEEGVEGCAAEGGEAEGVRVGVQRTKRSVQRVQVAGML